MPTVQVCNFTSISNPNSAQKVAAYDYTLPELDFLFIAIEPATVDPTMPNTSKVVARRLSQNVVFRSPKICSSVLDGVVGKDDVLGYCGRGE